MTILVPSIMTGHKMQFYCAAIGRKYSGVGMDAVPVDEISDGCEVDCGVTRVRKQRVGQVTPSEVFPLGELLADGRTEEGQPWEGILHTEISSSQRHVARNSDDDLNALSGESVHIHGVFIAADSYGRSAIEISVGKSRHTYRDRDQQDLGNFFHDVVLMPNGFYTRPNWREMNGYQPRTYAKTKGATMDASDSMMYFGVSIESFSHVIFSLGMAPE